MRKRILLAVAVFAVVCPAAQRACPAAQVIEFVVSAKAANGKLIVVGRTLTSGEHVLLIDRGSRLRTRFWQPSDRVVVIYGTILGRVRIVNFDQPLNRNFATASHHPAKRLVELPEFVGRVGSEIEED